MEEQKFHLPYLEKHPSSRVVSAYLVVSRVDFRLPYQRFLGHLRHLNRLIHTWKNVRPEHEKIRTYF